MAPYGLKFHQVVDQRFGEFYQYFWEFLEPGGPTQSTPWKMTKMALFDLFWGDCVNVCNGQKGALGPKIDHRFIIGIFDMRRHMLKLNSTS